MPVNVQQFTSASQPVGHIDSGNASNIQVLNTQISYKKLIKKGYYNIHEKLFVYKNKNKSFNNLSIIKCITDLNKRNQTLCE